MSLLTHAKAAATWVWTADWSFIIAIAQGGLLATGEVSSTLYPRFLGGPHGLARASAGPSRGLHTSIAPIRHTVKSCPVLALFLREASVHLTNFSLYLFIFFFFLRQLPCKGCRGGNENISELCSNFWCERCKHDTTYQRKILFLISFLSLSD